MASSNNSGSQKRKRGPRRMEVVQVNSEETDNSNESPQPNKDVASRGRAKKCFIAVEDFICDFTGDDSIRTTILWKEKQKLVKKANKLLNDPLFMLQKLSNLIEPSIMENTRLRSAFDDVKSTLQQSKNPIPTQDSTDNIALPEFELALKQSKNPVPTQDSTDNIALQEFELALKQSKNPVPTQYSTDIINELERDVQVTKEELQFIKEQLKEENAIGDLEKQLLMTAKTFLIVSRMMNKVQESCFRTVSNALGTTQKSIQEQFIQREDEQLVLHFRPAPDSIQTNQSGKTDNDVHNSKMINQEELVVEVDLTLAFVGERPEKLILKMQRDQKMDALWGIDIGHLNNNILSTDGLGFRDAKTHQEIGESCTVSSKVRSYNVDKHNVNLLKQIFEENPNIDKEFKIKNPDFQSFFMNKIALSYDSIKRNPWIFGPRDVKTMFQMVEDMQFTELEHTWLKNEVILIRQVLMERYEAGLTELKECD
ncbi:uncharacterized protein LOC120139183 [Hibiscus syriacus]|uniref:uncharacterized protein LOC120139183 n=1 Tax=Hibiscus syriacus TaxID=106335 RepID=UPI001920C400|nr:uncharacterized protein LOC120139183 [Hibiscus syriacus]